MALAVMAGMRLSIVLLAVLGLGACDPGMVGGEEDFDLDEFDSLGDRAPFNVPECETDSYLPFRGDLHSHTGYSDGAEGSTPAQAFRFARDESNLDFLAVTDHGSKLTSSEYSKCRSSADSATDPGTFVAICGCEINAGSNSHANLLFAPSVFTNATSIPGIYAKLESCDGCIGQINHPASDRFPWADFTRDREADAKLHQVELNGGSWDESLARYIRALDRGWRVGPSWDSDTHAADWGSGTRRTVLFAKNLARADLRQALGHHRVCATDDRNAALVLKADQCWMGSSPRGRTGATMHVEATDLNAHDGFKSITLYGRGGKKLGTVDCDGKTICTGSKKLSITPPTYVFAVATQADGDHVVTAPVWFRR
jgi:hypothetical protein